MCFVFVRFHGEHYGYSTDRCQFAAALWDRVENVVAATFWITWNASSWTSKRQRRRYFITVGSPDDLLPGRIRRGALGCKPLVWSQLCHPTRPPPHTPTAIFSFHLEKSPQYTAAGGFIRLRTLSLTSTQVPRVPSVSQSATADEKFFSEVRTPPQVAMNSKKNTFNLCTSHLGSKKKEKYLQGGSRRWDDATWWLSLITLQRHSWVSLMNPFTRQWVAAARLS